MASCTKEARAMLIRGVSSPALVMRMGELIRDARVDVWQANIR